MIQCILANLPNWIQALAAVCIVPLTLLTLIVLKRYAADTKKIARASASQLENSEMPFLAIVQHQLNGWIIENQGFGPAINGSWSYVQGGRHTHQIPSLAPKATHTIQNLFAPVVANQAGIEIAYESLSGLKYRTVMTWERGDARVIQMRFERP